MQANPYSHVPLTVFCPGESQNDPLVQAVQSEDCVNLVVLLKLPAGHGVDRI